MVATSEGDPEMIASHRKSRCGPQHMPSGSGDGGWRIRRDGRLVTRVPKRADGGSRKFHEIATIESLRPYLDDFRTALVELAAAA